MRAQTPKPSGVELMPPRRPAEPVPDEGDEDDDDGDDRV